jgi:type II secretory ATPase GspE/PulE/Tfp pilus assembly ATPase PilB-like protein
MLPPGFENLTAPDISHAISLIPVKGARLLARVCYAEQKSFADELEHELLLKLKRAARREKWHNTKPLKRLARIVVAVYVPERCPACRGVGYKQRGEKIVRCVVCTVKVSETATVSHGWGRVYYSDIARELGVTTVTMSRTWKRRYGLALDVLTRWDQQCWDGFAKALHKTR